MIDRIRGRKLQQLRERFKRQNPLCVECQKAGIVREWAHLDHIIPVVRGGTNDDSNLQGLCVDHHRAKTLAEFGLKDRSPNKIGNDGWPI